MLRTFCEAGIQGANVSHIADKRRISLLKFLTHTHTHPKNLNAIFHLLIIACTHYFLVSFSVSICANWTYNTVLQSRNNAPGWNYDELIIISSAWECSQFFVLFISLYIYFSFRIYVFLIRIHRKKKNIWQSRSKNVKKQPKEEKLIKISQCWRWAHRRRQQRQWWSRRRWRCRWRQHPTKTTSIKSSTGFRSLGQNPIYI